MSFYEELKYKADNIGEIEKQEILERIKNDCRKTVVDLKRQCEEQIKDRCIKGYLHVEHDIGNDEYLAEVNFDSTVESLGLKSRENTPHILMSSERSIDNCLLTFNGDTVDYYKRYLSEELEDLGFKNYIIIVKEVPNRMLIETVVGGTFSYKKKVRRHIEKRGTVLAMYIEVHW
ncbi:MAG: hypothetical protein IKT68_07635 [Clostridia bacterium]|nr:hypothetical protein [Clostridia bacterium]